MRNPNAILIRNQFRPAAQELREGSPTSIRSRLSSDGRWLEQDITIEQLGSVQSYTGRQQIYSAEELEAVAQEAGLPCWVITPMRADDPFDPQASTHIVTVCAKAEGRARALHGNSNRTLTRRAARMATMYCALCGRPVEANRRIGAGTLFFAIITGGLSLLAVPFYPKRCAICRSTAVSLTPPEGAGGAAGASLPARLAELEKRLRLVEEELESAGVDLNRLKTERDFYRELLGDPTSRRGTTSGG